MSNDVQAQLLSYFTRGSLTHGAMLFAAVMAILYFLNLVKTQSEIMSLGKYWSILIISAILMSICFYILGRIVSYGTLAYHTIMTQVNNTNTVSIKKYYEEAMSSALESKFSPLILMFGNIGKPIVGLLPPSMIFSLALGFPASHWILWIIDIIDFSKVAYLPELISLLLTFILMIWALWYYWHSKKEEKGKDILETSYRNTFVLLLVIFILSLFFLLGEITKVLLLNNIF